MGNNQWSYIESKHPPLRLLKLPIGDETIDACPYKKPQDSDAQNLKNIVVQNNFTNAHLHNIGKQLSRIEGQPHLHVEPSGTTEKRLKNPMLSLTRSLTLLNKKSEHKNLIFLML